MQEFNNEKKTSDERFDPIAEALNLSETIDVVDLKKADIQQKLSENANSIIRSEQGPLEKPSKQEKTMEDDLDVARSNLKEMIQKNSEALEMLLELALQSESASVYESLSMLIKSGIDASKELVQLHKTTSEAKKVQKQTQEIGKPKDQSNEQKTPVPGDQTLINNAVFVGSTKELLESFGQRRRIPNEVQQPPESNEKS